MSPVSPERRYYYDACALDYDKSILGEIIKNNKFNIKSVVSHLALGEAYANCKLKSEEIEDSFTDLIRSMGSYLTIVHNDGVEGEILKVKEIFPALSITDSMHLAAALKHKCSVLRTRDRDFFGQDSEKLKEIGNHFGITNFCVSKIEI